MTDVFDGGVELVERAPERAWQGIVRVGQDRGVGSKDPAVQFAVEEGDATTVRSEDVGVRSRPALDQSAKPESPEVVRHLPRGIGSAEQRGNAWAKVAMPETCRHVREATERLKDGQDTRIGEAERGDSLRAQPEGLLQEV